MRLHSRTPSMKRRCQHCRSSLIHTSSISTNRHKRSGWSFEWRTALVWSRSIQWPPSEQTRRARPWSIRLDKTTRREFTLIEQIQFAFSWESCSDDKCQCCSLLDEERVDCSSPFLLNDVAWRDTCTGRSTLPPTENNSPGEQTSPLVAQQPTGRERESTRSSSNTQRQRKASCFSTVRRQTFLRSNREKKYRQMSMIWQVELVRWSLRCVFLCPLKFSNENRCVGAFVCSERDHVSHLCHRSFSRSAHIGWQLKLHRLPAKSYQSSLRNLHLDQLEWNSSWTKSIFRKIRWSESGRLFRVFQ